MKIIGSLWLLSFFLILKVPAQTITSPDKNIRVQVKLVDGKIFYSATYKDQPVLLSSRLGLTTMEEDFAEQMVLLNASAILPVKNQYRMVNAKRSSLSYRANKKIFYFRNNKGKLVDIQFQVSNDGIAFRYYFPAAGNHTITKEHTSFHFLPETRGWLQPMSKSKTGWEHTHPSYEEHYLQNISVNDTSPTGAGWVYPALFKKENNWLLITESSLDRNYCGSHLQTSGVDELQLAFPDSTEIFPGGGVLPQSSAPFYSPWRIICVGGLKTIVESTLGTDLAKPTRLLNDKFVKPGKASWSWIMSKDNYIIYEEQKKYIDFASDMKWQYCLIDVDWDTKIGYDKIAELVAYGQTKKVGLLLWYNSSGNWNTTKYHPKSMLLTRAAREKEFSRLQRMGIKGVKIDFFGGDGQSVIEYYIDILEDAARYNLLVNFHGATLPRGWQRTYPHLLTTEAIRGFEMVTFGQDDADKQSTHCTLLPFTRNAFDPMDFTPMNLYKIATKVTRKTTSAFELALSVLFLSGIQHYAESPEGMSHVPAYVKTFLQQLPNNWDEVRYIDGFPGKEVIIARRAGKKWYIAGINGEATDKTWQLDISFLKNKTVQLITDGADPLSFADTKKVIGIDGKLIVTVKANGGFVAVAE